MGIDLKMEIHESGGKLGSGDAPFVPERTYGLQVRLRREWVGYREATGTEVVLDFARRRRLTLDEGARTYVDESLYSEVCFRRFELPNREYVRSVLAAGGGDTAELEPILAEHQLSMLDKARGRTLAEPNASRNGKLGGFLRSVFGSKRGDISVESEQGHTVYATAAGRRLFSYADEGTEAAPDMSRRFAQFLRYLYMGHPLILERLASASRIPRELRYQSRESFGQPRSDVTLRLGAVDVVPDGEIALDGYRRVVSSDQPLPSGVLERVMFGAVPDSQEVKARRMAEAKQCAEGGRLLESVLTLLELTLETGASLPELGNFLQHATDPHVRQLRDALGQRPGSQQEAHAVLAMFLGLRKAAGQRAHVVMTFEAPLHRALGEAQQACGLLLKAIEVNPFLTGAYKDLGDLYVGEYRMREAWLCWEAARRIAPDHRLLEDVRKLEEMLAAEHPEYF
jgi:tetratricopeptide (TPR) repeat protein